MFAKHGFQEIAVRLNLEKFAVRRKSKLADLSIEEHTQSVAERLRLAFEELGPTFIKFGQILASRPDLVPEAVIEEFRKLQDGVNAMPYSEVQMVIESETGVPIDSFLKNFERIPLGAASIAQAHRAELMTGETVVIKVQRPGLLKIIEDDVHVLYFLAGLLESYIEEARVYRPLVLVEEFAKALELETNFLVEANNIRRFRRNFPPESDVIIPHVYLDLTTEKILVMEYLDGVPLSRINTMTMPFAIDKEKVVRLGLRTFYQMVFEHGLFHGDLHAGNFFLLSENRIGLVDFGVVGRLTPRAKSSIASMMIALGTEDYDRMAYEYLELAPFDERIDADLFARDLRELIAPYYGLSLRNVNLGALLLKSAKIAADHHVSVPTELILFFKSVVHIEALGRTMIEDFDFLSQAIEYSHGLVKEQYDPAGMLKEAEAILRDSFSLVRALPRELRQTIRRMNQPGYAMQIEIRHMDGLQRAISNLAHLLFLSIVILSLMLASTLIFVFEKGPLYLGYPLFAMLGFLAAGLLGFLSTYHYLKR